MLHHLLGLFKLTQKHIDLLNCRSAPFGDSLSSDIAGADNAGIECVWYNAAGKEPVGARPDHTARTYAEILRIIDQRP